MSEKQAVTIVTQANKALSKTTGDLLKVITKLEELTNISSLMSDEIALKQADLNSIEEKIENQHRKAVAELKLKILENEKEEFLNLLVKFNMAKISVEDLKKLEIELDEAKSDNTETIEKAVNAAKKVLHVEYGGQISSLKADHKVDVAQKDAKINSLELQIDFLEQNVESLKETINDERNARIRIAEADSKKIPVQVNTTTK